MAINTDYFNLTDIAFFAPNFTPPGFFDLTDFTFPGTVTPPSPSVKVVIQVWFNDVIVQEISFPQGGP